MSLNNQTNKGALMSLKGYIYIYIYVCVCVCVCVCGVHLGLLPQTSLVATCLPSPSLPVLVRLLPRGDLGLYLYFYLFYCARIFNSYRICARTWIYIGFMPTYSIPRGYVHKFCVLLFRLA